MLTAEIDRIPSRSEYDDLLRRIRKSAAERGLGDNLDSILRQQSLVDQPEWKDRNRNLAEVMSEYVDRLPAGEADRFLSKVHEVARQRGLDPADLAV